MSAIKNCTLLLCNNQIDSYHIDSTSAHERADKLLDLWQHQAACGSEHPRPLLRIMTATEFIESRKAVDF